MARSNTESVEAFLCHPLSCMVVPQANCTVWTCRTTIPGGEGFTLRRKPTHVPAQHPGILASTCTWLSRRGIHPRSVCGGIVDIDGGTVFPVDLVGERRGRAVLVIIYCTPRRRQGWHEMRRYALQIAAAAETTYRLRPQVALLNGYGSARIVGELLGT